LRRWRRELWHARAWREFGAFRRAIAVERYEAILDLQEQLKGAIVSRLARGTRHGFDRASAREPVATLLDDRHHRVPRELHFATRCRMLAGAALGYAVEGAPRWSFAATPLARATPPGRYAIALHATSRASKLWPDERWRSLLERLSRAGLATLLPWGSDAERARSERLAEGIANSIVPPRQTLAELVALLQRAELAVGVDTGLTHLAAALGTPTVALFTETDPRGAGVAIAGAHAKDVGGNGHVPSLDEADAALADVMRTVPRC
jgi:heptosyltransferase-1